MKTCPITTLKIHSSGATYAPELVGTNWHLMNANGDILTGYRGNTYNFKSEKNARVWLCTNLSRFANSVENTDTNYIIKLMKIYANTQFDFVLKDIEAISEFERGEWQVVECNEVRVVYEQIGDIDGGNESTIYKNFIN